MAQTLQEESTLGGTAQRYGFPGLLSDPFLSFPVPKSRGVQTEGEGGEKKEEKDRDKGESEEEERTVWVVGASFQTHFLEYSTDLKWFERREISFYEISAAFPGTTTLLYTLQLRPLHLITSILFHPTMPQYVAISVTGTASNSELYIIDWQQKRKASLLNKHFHLVTCHSFSDKTNALRFTSPSCNQSIFEIEEHVWSEFKDNSVEIESHVGVCEIDKREEGGAIPAEEEPYRWLFTWTKLPPLQEVQRQREILSDLSRSVGLHPPRFSVIHSLCWLDGSQLCLVGRGIAFERWKRTGEGKENDWQLEVFKPSDNAGLSMTQIIAQHAEPSVFIGSCVIDPRAASTAELRRLDIHTGETEWVKLFEQSYRGVLYTDEQLYVLHQGRLATTHVNAQDGSTITDTRHLVNGIPVCTLDSNLYILRDQTLSTIGLRTDALDTVFSMNFFTVPGVGTSILEAHILPNKEAVLFAADMLHIDRQKTWVYKCIQDAAYLREHQLVRVSMQSGEIEWRLGTKYAINRFLVWPEHQVVVFLLISGHLGMASLRTGKLLYFKRLKANGVETIGTALATHPSGHLAVGTYDGCVLIFSLAVPSLVDLSMRAVQEEKLGATGGALPTDLAERVQKPYSDDCAAYGDLYKFDESCRCLFINETEFVG